MKQLVWLLGIIVLSQISGCASLLTSTGNADDQIDRWLSQQEYGKALALVAELRESPSLATRNLQETQERIDVQIASYEQRVVAEAESAAGSGDWGTAFDLYHDALSRLPESTRLQQGEQQLLRRHAEYVEMLEMDRLIAKGEWMLKELEISRLAEAKKPHSWIGQYSLDRKIGSANELALDLAERGKRALEHRDLTLAQRVLPLASNLSNAIEIAALNARFQEMRKEEELRILNEQKRIAEAQLAEEKVRGERQEKKQRSAIDIDTNGQEQKINTNGPERKKAALLMADFKKACHEKDFVRAQRLMLRLEKQGVDDPEFEHLSKELATDVARHVKHLIKIGVIHYSQQQYNEALNVWKQAQILDPKNEQLTARIKRVTRVINNLQNLRTKSGVTE